MTLGELLRPRVPELTVAGVLALVAASSLATFIPFFLGIDDVVIRPLGSRAQMPEWPLVAKLVAAAGTATVLASFLPLDKRHAQPRVQSFWSAIWSGSMGRAFFRLVAALMPFRPTPFAASTEPTETMLANAAEAMLRDLPAEHRARFIDAPVVIERLRAHAQALHARRTEIASAMAQGNADTSDDAVAELESVTSMLSDHYGAAVGALENLRLDLMRLRSDATAIDNFTADLRAARGIGDEIERLLAGKREVSGLLRRPQLP